VNSLFAKKNRATLPEFDKITKLKVLKTQERMSLCDVGDSFLLPLPMVVNALKKLKYSEEKYFVTNDSLENVF